MSVEIEYILAYDIELVKAEEILSDDNLEATPSLRDDYIAIDTTLNRNYLINSSIYNFLQLFKEPVLLDNVLDNVLKAMQIASNDTKSTEHVVVFINDLMNMGFIIPKEENERLKNEQENNQEISVNGYITEKVYKQTYNMWVGLVKRESDMQLVVVKKMLLDDETDEESKRAFVQEFTIMGEISDHPAICKLYSLNKTKLEAEIEYVDGETLRSYIKNKIPSLQKRIELISSLLDAFSYFQQKNVVHGDIHASNFMLTKYETLKIIDFGMSNHTSLQDNEIIKIGGVYNYIPPERVSTEPFIIMNKKSTDFMAEVYQLGIIMYFILYGKIPFQGLTWQVLAKNICDEKPVFSQQTGSGEDIPKAILKILEKTLQKDPARRYLNATKLYEVWILTIKKVNGNSRYSIEA